MFAAKSRRQISADLLHRQQRKIRRRETRADGRGKGGFRQAGGEENAEEEQGQRGREDGSGSRRCNPHASGNSARQQVMPVGGLAPSADFRQWQQEGGPMASSSCQRNFNSAETMLAPPG